MKPAAFDYHRPETVEEAIELLEEHGPTAELMAGNQSLGIIMANRLATPDHLIDLNGVGDIGGIAVGDETARIGAMARHREIERSDELSRTVPMLPEAAGQIAGPAVRNRGTMGGAVAEAHPAGNYPTALVALEGDIELIGPDGERRVAAEDFFLGPMVTGLGERELIESVSVDLDPFPTDRTGMAFVELKRAAQTFPTISAAAAVRVDGAGGDGSSIVEARVALANADDFPLRVPEAEVAVEGEPIDAALLKEVSGIVYRSVDPAPEVHADSDYKGRVAGEYAKRALVTAYERAIE